MFPWIPDVRASAVRDPRGFLEMNPPPVIFDEVQYAPDLLAYIKERIDENRNARGLSRLLPLSRREEHRKPQESLPAAFSGSGSSARGM